MIAGPMPHLTALGPISSPFSFRVRVRVLGLGLLLSLGVYHALVHVRRGPRFHDLGRRRHPSGGRGDRARAPGSVDAFWWLLHQRGADPSGAAVDSVGCFSFGDIF